MPHFFARIRGRAENCNVLNPLPSIFLPHRGCRRNQRPGGGSLTQSRTPWTKLSGLHTATIYSQGMLRCIPQVLNAGIPHNILYHLLTTAFFYTSHFSSRRDCNNPTCAAPGRGVCRRFVPLLLHSFDPPVTRLQRRAGQYHCYPYSHFELIIGCLPCDVKAGEL